MNAQPCAAWALEPKCGLLSPTRLHSKYLILIDAIHVLPGIFEKIHVPIEVRDELTCDAAPPSVRTWMQQPPQWLEVLAAPAVASEDSSLQALDSGERAAILLAESIRADHLLIDDRPGALLAQRRGFAVTGTLGVLDWPLGQGCFICATPSCACRKPTSGIHPRSWKRCWRKREAARKEMVRQLFDLERGQARIKCPPLRPAPKMGRPSFFSAFLASSF